MTDRAATRWAWFAAWALPGACLALCVSVVGIVTVPVGVLLAAALSRRHRGAPALGLLAGAGGVLTGIGGANLDYHACNSALERGYLTPGGARSISYSCGGVDGVPWMVSGVVVILIALILFLLALRGGLRGHHV